MSLMNRRALLLFVLLPLCVFASERVEVSTNGCYSALVLDAFLKEMGIDPAVAMKKMESAEGKEQGTLMDSRQVILNILSLCIFPFAARPVVTEILFNGDNDAYIAAMKQRKQMLPLLVEKFMIQNTNS